MPKELSQPQPAPWETGDPDALRIPPQIVTFNPAESPILKQAAARGLTDWTVRTILAVNGGTLPLRFFAGLSEPAFALENLKDQHIPIPQKRQQIVPLYSHAYVNGLNPGETAATLRQVSDFSQWYIQTFHPGIPVADTIYDNPEALPNKPLRLAAESLIESLPSQVIGRLASMAQRYSHIPDPAERTLRAIEYLLMHLDYYGEASLGFYPETNHILYISPGSERSFLNTLKRDRPSFAQVINLAPRRTITTLLTKVKNAPYITYPGEPTISSISQGWPTAIDIDPHGPQKKLHQDVTHALEITTSVIARKFGPNNLQAGINLLSEAIVDFGLAQPS